MKKLKNTFAQKLTHKLTQFLVVIMFVAFNVATITSVSASIKDTIITQQDVSQVDINNQNTSMNLLCNDTYISIDSVSVTSITTSTTRGDYSISSTGDFSYDLVDTSSYWFGYDSIQYIVKNIHSNITYTDTMVVQIGTDAQIVSFNIIKEYLGVSMLSTISGSNTVNLSSNGILTTNPLAMYPAGSGSTWIILTNGNIQFDKWGDIKTYTLTSYTDVFSSITVYGFTIGSWDYYENP